MYRLLLPDLPTVRVASNVEEEARRRKDSKSGAQTPEELAEESRGESRIQSRIETALRFLDADERKVAELLLEANGTMLQKDISWKTGFSRVKTHRVLARLIRRGLVSAEKYYSTNRIFLSESLSERNDKSHPQDKGEGY